MESELSILKGDPSHTILPSLEPVCSLKEFMDCRAEAAGVFCDESLMRAIVKICSSTRESAELQAGVSPRGGLMLLAACRGLALVSGRGLCNRSGCSGYVSPCPRTPGLSPVQ